jgi:hypothetical protein
MRLLSLSPLRSDDVGVNLLLSRVGGVCVSGPLSRVGCVWMTKTLFSMNVVWLDLDQLQRGVSG